MFLELLAVDLRVHEHAREVVGGVLLARGDQVPAALEDLGDVFLDRALEAVRVDVGIAGAERRVHEVRPHRVVLLGDAHEAADHARDDRLGDVGDQVARLTAFQTVEHLGRDRPDRVLVRCDASGGEARLEERLQAVVLGRVHADEHRLRELQREAGGGNEHAAAFG